jgi:hypothetical protein
MMSQAEKKKEKEEEKNLQR